MTPLSLSQPEPVQQFSKSERPRARESRASGGASPLKPKAAKSALKKKRILIVDDHPMMRDGLALTIGREADLMVSGQVENAGQALAAVVADAPDLVLAEISLPDTSGVELIKNIKAVSPQLPILIISMRDESLYAERALRAGATGYLMKVEGGERLIEAIHRVMAGEVYVSDRVAARILRGMNGQSKSEPRSPVEQLSDREFEVFRLIAQGISTREIGEQLHISSKTVEAHRANIKAKLRLDTAPALTAYAAQWMSAEAFS